MALRRAARVLVTFALAAAVLAVHADPGSDFADGKAVGNTWRGPLLDGVRSGSAAATNPQQTSTPAESGYYGRANLSSEAAALRSACASTPNDPRCAALATGTASRPRLTILPSDPALAADGVIKDPSQILGDISTTYSACATSTSLVSPAVFATQTCSMSTTGWSANTCEKELDSVPADRMTCVNGSLMQVIQTGYYSHGIGKWIQMYADVKCDVVRKDDKLTFRVGACMDCPSAGPMAGADLEIVTPHTAVPPALVAQIPMKYGVANIYEEGPGCVNNDCEKTLLFYAPGGWGPTYSCPAPAFHGVDLRYEQSESVWVPLADGSCYEEAGSGIYAQNTLTASMGFYRLVGPATEGPWQVLPTSYVERFTLHFKRPALDKLAGEYWTNTCASFEADTASSKLPPDGVNQPVSGPLFPVARADQCQRVASVCVEGPSTKVIDGYPVTRECWKYVNQFDCTTLTAASTCSAPPLNACTPKGPASCAAVDGMVPPHCLVADMQVECKVADAVYGPVTNCGTSSFCPNGTCWDQAATPDPDFARSISMLEAARQAGRELNVETLRTFSGSADSCHSWPLNCCTTAPLIPPICPEEEKQLAQRRDAGLCHLVEAGWCSSRVLSVCVQKKDSYCCFAGKMSRIVNEQGRPQIAKGWGSGQNPDCTGFLVTELQRLDFAAMDFTEFYADIKSKMPDLAATQNDAAAKSDSCYYGAGKC